MTSSSLPYSLSVYVREKTGLRVQTPLSGSSDTNDMNLPLPEAASWNTDGTSLAIAEASKDIAIIQARKNLSFVLFGQPGINGSCTFCWALTYISLLHHSL